MDSESSVLDDEIPGMLSSGRDDSAVAPEDLVPQVEVEPPKEAQRRTDQRFRVRWKVGIVVGEGASRKVHVMRSHDVSVGGMAVLCNDKIPPAEKYVVLLVMPALNATSKEVVLETQAKIMYSVLDTSKDCFRLGIRFLNFKSDGQKFLRDRLEKHHVPVTGT